MGNTHTAMARDREHPVMAQDREHPAMAQDGEYTHSHGTGWGIHTQPWHRMGNTYTAMAQDGESPSSDYAPVGRTERTGKPSPSKLGTEG